MGHSSLQAGPSWVASAFSISPQVVSMLVSWLVRLHVLQLNWWFPRWPKWLVWEQKSPSPSAVKDEGLIQGQAAWSCYVHPVHSSMLRAAPLCLLQCPAPCLCFFLTQCPPMPRTKRDVVLEVDGEGLFQAASFHYSKKGEKAHWF